MSFNGVSFYGIVHQSGGCGPELLGAIELLQKKEVPVRCIVASGDPCAKGRRSAYLGSRGVEVVEYSPGIFSDSKVLLSFGEYTCFEYIKHFSDRPPWVVWSSCMSWVDEPEVEFHSEGLIDEFFFQSERIAGSLAPEIARRSSKPVFYRPGYKAFINPESDFAKYQAFVSKSSSEFRVLKAVRDDQEKWHEETWRMFCGVVSPRHRPVHIEIAGWGDFAQKKIGNPCDPTSKWNGVFDITLHSHIYDPVEMSRVYGRAHALLHFYPFVESYGFATLQAMLAGCVPVGAAEGGFLDLITHGETGFLVSSPDEAAYFTSKLAFEDRLWGQMSAEAQRWVVHHGPGNPQLCWPWWEKLLEKCEISF